MTTRAERAAQSKARLLARREALDRQLAHDEGVIRSEARKANDKRRYLVGKLVEEAGLFAWSDAQLAEVMQALAPFAPLPNAPLRLAQVLIRAPLAQWLQEAAEVAAEVQALIDGKVTVVVVDDEGRPLTRHDDDPAQGGKRL